MTLYYAATLECHATLTKHDTPTSYTVYRHRVNNVVMLFNDAESHTGSHNNSIHFDVLNSIQNEKSHP